MSLFNHLLRHRAEPIRSIVPEERPLERFLAADASGLIHKKVSAPDFQHRCGIEPLEEREMLSADGMTVTLATVYLEVGQESKGDMFSVCWVGDAAVEDSTRLEKITINIGSEGYFDTTADPPGVGDESVGYHGYLPFTLVTEDTYGTGQVSTISLDDFTYFFDGDPNNTTGNGASSLTIVFNNGLKQGETLVFLADVDHREDPTDTTYFEDRDVITSGGFVTAWFTSEHFIMSETIADFNAENSNERYYTKEYELPASVDLLSNKGAELGYDTGMTVTNEGNNTAAVVTDIVLDVKPKISGYVYADVVKDCYYNADDPQYDYGISDVLVTLEQYDSATGQYIAVDSMYTDVNGFYEFDGLNSAQYRVTSDHDIPYVEYGVNYVYADSCARSQSNPVSSNPLVLVTNVSVGNDSINNNFGKVLRGSIEGNVYEDRNDNGVMEDGEPGIGKVTVGLYYLDGSGQYVKYLVDGEHYSVETDVDGHYKFDNLKVYDKDNGTLYMTYAVKEIQPTEYTDGKDAVGTIDGEKVGKIESNDYMTEIKLGWNQHGIDYDFGELLPGSIAGNVFEDRNDNGIMESNEPGISNVKVELLQWNGAEYEVVASQKTSDDGSYYFGNLDINGQYAIRETQPTEYIDGKEQLGTFNGVERGEKGEDEFLDIDVGWDEHGVNYNFGELKLGSVAGYVYEDHNDNGVYDRGTDAADKPISGVTVALYYKVGSEYIAVLDAEGKARTDVTDNNGYYCFDNLDIEKNYAIRETQPTEYTDGKDTLGYFNGDKTDVRGKVGSNDEFTDVDVHWEDEGVEYNFGELKLGSLSGHIFYDANDDGVFDKNAGDYGLVGETVTLHVYNGSQYTGAVTATTGADGYYLFDKLAINKIYSLTETQPSGYTDGKDSVGTINGVHVGTLVRSDYMNSIDVEWDEHGINYDFGEILPEPTPDPPTPGYNEGVVTPLRLPTHYAGGPVNPFNYLPTNVATAPVTINKYGGGGGASAYTWHLSVLNGGYPRSIKALGSVAGFRAMYGDNQYMQVAWSGQATNRGLWLIRSADGTVKQYVFGAENAIPVVGDWNGDGTDSIGFYVDGQWCLDRNGDGVWDNDDLWAELGHAKDQPVSGDWDGDGKDDIGVFGPQWSGDPLAIAVEPGLPADQNPNTFRTVSRAKNVPPEYTETNVAVRVVKHRNAGEVRVDLIDHVFEYGQEGDKAVTGDWNGDGIDKIGVFRDGTWYVDVNGNGVWDEGDVMISGFGSAESVPVVGDWDGDGIDNIGLFEDGRWSLDTNGDYKPDSSFEFGQAGDRPVTGDFNGDGSVEFGVYRAQGEADVQKESISL